MFIFAHGATSHVYVEYNIGSRKERFRFKFTADLRSGTGPNKMADSTDGGLVSKVSEPAAEEKDQPGEEVLSNNVCNQLC